MTYYRQRARWLVATATLANAISAAVNLAFGYWYLLPVNAVGFAACWKGWQVGRALPDRPL